MRTSLRSLPLSLPVLLALACGGGGGDDDGAGGDGAGDAQEVDAGGGGATPDSAPAAYAGLGQTCTGDGQGDCPDGFTCVALEGGSWCSKMCTPGTNGPCQEGYSGPGQALCLIGVDTDQPPDGEADFSICGVVCDNDNGQICDAETCDGTCPDELACTGPVMNTAHETIATACE